MKWADARAGAALFGAGLYHHLSGLRLAIAKSDAESFSESQFFQIARPSSLARFVSRIDPRLDARHVPVWITEVSPLQQKSTRRSKPTHRSRTSID
jgi:hypothetical protein